MKRYKATVKLGKKVTYTGESEHPYYALREAHKAIDRELYRNVAPLNLLAEGESGVVPLNIRVNITCIMNRRAKRRAPEVIAAEKKAQAQNRQTKLAAEAEQLKRQQKLMQQRRRRISNQIDHAFKSGSESGSEPVSKFVTCENCDAPATFLTLNRAVPSGAAVLDETSVIGAVCNEHNYSGSPYYRRASGVPEFFPVARLEFFYTGIRQIGIKAKP